MSSNNPTAMSAVVGEELEIGESTSPGAVLVRALIMPAILVAFATYLLIGIITMRIPEGTTFPGPEFFPAIIMIGLYVFAALLVIGAVKEWRTAVNASTEEIRLVAEEDTAKHVGVDWRSFAWVVLGFLGFVLLLKWLGWIIGGALLFWCVARGFGASRPIFTVFVGLTTSSLTYILFDMLLGLTLPSGILGWGF
ncbi:MAG: tripartite tricarboxylate transporter TctB family protein [Leucobacter sp.]